MISIKRSPLDAWIAGKIGQPSHTALRRTDLKRYQLENLRRTIEHAKKNSPFYAKHLSNIKGRDLKSLDDLKGLPFTTPRDVIDHGLRMVCVSQSRIERVITLQSSGTTASPKRIYFTEEDLELTADFFAHGMQALVRPGDRVMVLMPGPNVGSVGERLLTGLGRIGCPTTVYGLVDNPEELILQIIDQDIGTLVGLPAQVLSLVRHPLGKKLGMDKNSGDGTSGKKGIQSVLLSADYVPMAIVEAIEAAWHCPVFTHWGMTETGLGGAVQCRARQGAHLREADLLVEMVDPEGEARVPHGAWGEIVLTTLTRTGMPLIRYRTGDRSRFLTDPCPCGSRVKRVDRVKGRSVYHFSDGTPLRLDALDEALFRLSDLIDFEVRLQPSQPSRPSSTLSFEENVRAQHGNGRTEGQNQGMHSLEIQFWAAQGMSLSRVERLQSEIHQTIENIPTIGKLKRQGWIEIKDIVASGAPLFSRGVKRKLLIDESMP